METPCFTTTLSGSESLQLPPMAAARSTITLPSRIDLTMSSVINSGAGLPGIKAVVMIISTSSACSANNAISALMNSSLITFAYPPEPLPSSSKSSIKKSASILSTCSFTSGLVSNALTIAPILFAAPIAAKPATPAPMTRTFAGGIFPAAVICPVKNLPKCCAASTIAL